MADMLSAHPDDTSEPQPDADAEFHRFVDAIERVMGPAPTEQQSELSEPVTGQWISGPCSPAPIVTAAVAALEAFGDLSRLGAAAILPMWRRYRELTPQQVAEVVGRFPGGVE